MHSGALVAVAVLTVFGAFAATPVSASAQRYRLQLTPRVGDTLQMELDEQREHTGTTKFGGSDSTRRMSTHLRMFSRAIVQGEAAERGHGPRDRRFTLPGHERSALSSFGLRSAHALPPVRGLHDARRRRPQRRQPVLSELVALMPPRYRTIRSGRATRGLARFP